MSLFGALMGDLDDDPFLGGHMRRMNSMMSNFLRDPFSDMMGRSMGSQLMPFQHGGSRGREVARYPQDDFGMGMGLMPMGFPGLRIFQDMGNNPNCHSFSSSTVMTMTSGPDGRPQVYQASQSVKQGPGGLRETKKTVADSRTGVKKMSIGHHIHDRAHIIEREQNVFSGEAEERQDYINLEEEEADDFNKEWETRTRSALRHHNAAVEYGSGSGSGSSSRRNRSAREPQLSLPPVPSPAPPSSGHSARHIYRNGTRPSHRYSALPSPSSCLVPSDDDVDDEEEDDEEEEPIVEEIQLPYSTTSKKRRAPSVGDLEPKPKCSRTQSNKVVVTPDSLSADNKQQKMKL